MGNWSCELAVSVTFRFLCQSEESCGENPSEWKRRAFADVIDAAFEYDEGRTGL